MQMRQSLDCLKLIVGLGIQPGFLKRPVIKDLRDQWRSGRTYYLLAWLRISCVASLIDFRVATQGTPADCGHPFQRNAGEELADRPVNLHDSGCLCICSTRCPARNILRPRVPWTHRRPDSKKIQSVTVHRESSGKAGRCCDLTDSSFVSTTNR